jgi:hypothetical protein
MGPPKKCGELGSLNGAGRCPGGRLGIVGSSLVDASPAVSKCSTALNLPNTVTLDPFALALAHTLAPLCLFHTRLYILGKSGCETYGVAIVPDMTN